MSEKKYIFSYLAKEDCQKVKIIHPKWWELRKKAKIDISNDSRWVRKSIVVDLSENELKMFTNAFEDHLTSPIFRLIAGKYDVTSIGDKLTPENQLKIINPMGFQLIKKNNTK